MKRISQSVDFKHYHEWQAANLQPCWLSSTWKSFKTVATDRGSAWWVPPWFTDKDATRTKLGDLLRRDLFCAGCQSLSPRHGIHIPSSLWESDLRQKRPCSHCPGHPEHPRWQFLADGTCLRTAELIRTCPHKAVPAQTAWNAHNTREILYGGPREQTSCGECGSIITHMPRPDAPFLMFSTDWRLTQDKDDSSLFGAEPDLDGRELAARLVDRFRLHERLYICPHHPIDGDRERCIVQLAPLLRRFQDALHKKDLVR